jgi:hypothetical protein
MHLADGSAGFQKVIIRFYFVKAIKEFISSLKHLKMYLNSCGTLP